MIRINDRISLLLFLFGMEWLRFVRFFRIKWSSALTPGVAGIDIMYRRNCSMGGLECEVRQCAPTTQKEEKERREGMERMEWFSNLIKKEPLGFPSPGSSLCIVNPYNWLLAKRGGRGGAEVEWASTPGTSHASSVLPAIFTDDDQHPPSRSMRIDKTVDSLAKKLSTSPCNPSRIECARNNCRISRDFKARALLTSHHAVPVPLEYQTWKLLKSIKSSLSLLHLPHWFLLLLLLLVVYNRHEKEDDAVRVFVVCVFAADNLTTSTVWVCLERILLFSYCQSVCLIKGHKSKINNHLFTVI